MSIQNDLDSHRFGRTMRSRIEGVLDRVGVTEWSQLGAIEPRRMRMIKGCGPVVLREIVKLVNEHCDTHHPDWYT